RRRRDHRLWVAADAQAEHRLIPRVGIAPRRNLVTPQFFVLLAANALRLVGGEHQRARAIGPFEARLRRSIVGTFCARANGEDSRLALDHDVARVIARWRDEVDEAEVSDPLAHGFSAGARFPETAAGQDE